MQKKGRRSHIFFVNKDRLFAFSKKLKAQLIVNVCLMSSDHFIHLSHF